MKNVSLKSFYLTLLFAGLTPLFFYAAVLNKGNQLFFALAGLSALMTIIYFFTDESKPEVEKSEKESIKAESKKFNPYKLQGAN